MMNFEPPRAPPAHLDSVAVPCLNTTNEIYTCQLRGKRKHEHLIYPL